VPRTFFEVRCCRLPIFSATLAVRQSCCLPFFGYGVRDSLLNPIKPGAFAMWSGRLPAYCGRLFNLPDRPIILAQTIKIPLRTKNQVGKMQYIPDSTGLKSWQPQRRVGRAGSPPCTAFSIS
jgi:hypothetical protein